MPKPFSKGEAIEWCQHYEICAFANAWDDNKKALKLLRLLEGEALATCMVGVN